MAIKAKITSTNSQGPQKVSVTVPASGGTVTSVTAIGDLTDVIASTLPDGAVLQYATASGNWTSRALIDDTTFPSSTATATSLHSGESIRNFILSGTSTLTNKTIDLDANTLTGTITEFNNALQSADFATLANVETFTNKTLTQPKIAEIDSLSTGGITLDADTDIVLDADGADIILKDGGSEFGRFTNSSGELVIKSSSSATTALTMSGSNVTVAGNLTVTGNATANGSTITLGDAASDTIAFGGTITGSLVFEGSTNDSFETTLTPGNPSADVTVTLPAATDTLVGKATTDTLTNKSIDLTDNTLSGTIAEFNTALSDGTFVTIADSQTLTNKTLTTPIIDTINATDFTIDASGDISLDAGGNDIKLKDSGTVFGQLTNSSGELVIKSSSSATSALTFSGANVTAEGNFTVDGNLTVSGSTTTVDSTTVNIQNAFVFEGGTDDSFETTLTTVDPTADRTISLPNATGRIVLSDTIDTLENKTLSTPIIAEIDSGSSITLDATTDINLDAGGADIVLKDDGTEFGRLSNSSGELVIKSGSSSTTAISMSGANVTIAGNLVVTGATENDGNITIGDAATDTITFGGTIQGSLVFEGSTADSFETTLTPGNPSGDITLTLPSSATDTIVARNTTDTLTNKTLTSPTINSPTIVFEGSTADSFETTLEVIDPTADRTITFQNASGTVAFLTDVTGGSTPGNFTTITLDNNITFEGSTADSFETTLAVTDPTADRTITLPNATGTLISHGMFSGDATVATSGALTLATVNSNVGQAGSATAIPVVTVNAKGLVTAVSTASITTTLTVGADSGSNDTVSLATDTLDFSGGSNITTTVSNNDISIALDASPTVTSLIFEGSTADSFETTLAVTDPTADRTITLPNSTGTLVVTADVSGDATMATSGALTLATVNSNTGSFGSTTSIPVITVNAKGLVTAMSTATIVTTLTVAADSGSDDAVSLATDTLNYEGGANITTTVSNNNIAIALDASPSVTALTTSANVNVGGSIVFEGSTADSFETTLTVTDPTADRTITFPNNTGTVALTSDITGGGQAGSFTNLTSSGNTILGNATSDTVTFNGRIASHFVPSADDTYTLGTASLKWAELHVSGSTIFLGGAQLTASGTTVVLPANSTVGDRAIPDADPTTGIVTRKVPLFTKAGGLSSAAKTFTFKASGSSDRVFDTFTKEDGAGITTQERALFSF